jgi:hypothetical protein
MLCIIISIVVIIIRTSINMDTRMYMSYMIMLLHQQREKGCEIPLNEPLQVAHILCLGSASAVWIEKESVNARGRGREQ